MLHQVSVVAWCICQITVKMWWCGPIFYIFVQNFDHGHSFTYCKVKAIEGFPGFCRIGEIQLYLLNSDHVCTLKSTMWETKLTLLWRRLYRVSVIPTTTTRVCINSIVGQPFFVECRERFRYDQILTCILSIKYRYVGTHINADLLVCTLLYLYFTDLVKPGVKDSPIMQFYFTKGPVENVSLLPRRGVKSEQEAGPTGGPAQTPVVWIPSGRRELCLPSKALLGNHTQCHSIITCSFICPCLFLGLSCFSCVGVRRDSRIVALFVSTSDVLLICIFAPQNGGRSLFQTQNKLSLQIQARFDKFLSCWVQLL